MAEFKFKCAGNDGNWQAGIVEADNEAEALATLDKRYGVVRDTKGNQKNPDVVSVAIINAADFTKIKNDATGDVHDLRGDDL